MEADIPPGACDIINAGIAKFGGYVLFAKNPTMEATTKKIIGI